MLGELHKVIKFECSHCKKVQTRILPSVRVKCSCAFCNAVVNIKQSKALYASIDQIALRAHYNYHSKNLR